MTADMRECQKLTSKTTINVSHTITGPMINILMCTTVTEWYGKGYINICRGAFTS